MGYDPRVEPAAPMIAWGPWWPDPGPFPEDVAPHPRGDRKLPGKPDRGGKTAGLRGTKQGGGSSQLNTKCRYVGPLVGGAFRKK